METETRMATPRQLALIERLRSETGTTLEKSTEDLTVFEASELIAGLFQKVGYFPNGRNAAERKNGGTGASRRNDFGAGARLGMAFKCVYRNWVTSGHNIFKHKQAFTKNVLDTYALINEIAEKA